ncbi:translation initiation factor IF-2-like [Hemicordylus capensis]|uniref:translation initiation factor IF-2-like n=1 Tax=Hemicordylus capensis TaxID=884348 RepID=UPI0023024FD5|nr:translation initiation factor IF-2-like [Hemicordylus capensis]
MVEFLSQPSRHLQPASQSLGAPPAGGSARLLPPASCPPERRLAGWAAGAPLASSLPGFSSRPAPALGTGEAGGERRAAPAEPPHGSQSPDSRRPRRGGEGQAGSSRGWAWEGARSPPARPGLAAQPLRTPRRVRTLLLPPRVGAGGGCCCCCCLWSPLCAAGGGRSPAAGGRRRQRLRTLLSRRRERERGGPPPGRLSSAPSRRLPRPFAPQSSPRARTAKTSVAASHRRLGSGLADPAQPRGPGRRRSPLQALETPGNKANHLETPESCEMSR